MEIDGESQLVLTVGLHTLVHTSLLVHIPTYNIYMRTYLTFTYAKKKLTSFFVFFLFLILFLLC